MSAVPDDPFLLVHAYCDGELDPANALSMERRIAEDPRLAAERDRIEALQRAMRRLPRATVPPPGLRQRIEALFGLRPRTRPSWNALAASVAVAVMVSAASTWLVLAPAPDIALSDTLVGGHIRALMAGQPTDVASSDRHTVKPWFNGRVAQAPRVVDLASQGFPLAGGRLDVVGKAPVVTLAYRHRQHLISLTQVPGEIVGSSTVRRTSGGYNVVGWTDDGVAYWAVSDLGLRDLENFARLFRTTSPDL
jgi:anti-sigma factor RsiW